MILFIINCTQFIIRTNKQKEITLSECLFIINLIVDNIIDDFEKEHERLKRKHMLNDSNKINSNAAYQNEYDTLLKTKAKKILSQLSPDVKKVLLQYYSNIGLITMIINKIINPDKL